MRRALVVHGPFRGITGHDRHVRAFVTHLAAEGVAIQLRDLPSWSPFRLAPGDREPWFETLRRPTRAAVAVHFCMPHQARPVPRLANVNYTMFEGSRIPAAWARANRRHDLVVVPTESSRVAWLAANVPGDRVRICPLGVDTERFRPGVTPLAIADGRGGDVSQYRVRVLNVSTLGPRKNLLGLLRVWLAATTAGDDAILVVKLTHAGDLTTLRLLRDLAELEKRMGKTREEAAPIVFDDRRLSDAALPALYAAATHYWSLSHGEGWDQPMCEAGAAGLQLIAPRHSAYTAYLDDRVAWLIPSRRVPAQQALFEGAEWWEPDADAAAAVITRIVRHPGARRASLRPRLVARFGWRRAARQLLALVETLRR